MDDDVGIEERAAVAKDEACATRAAILSAGETGVVVAGLRDVPNGNGSSKSDGYTTASDFDVRFAMTGVDSTALAASRFVIDAEMFRFLAAESPWG